MSDQVFSSEVHRKVFEFVDSEEYSDSGVGVAKVCVGLDLDGVPGFQEVVLIEDAFFDLVGEGFFSMKVFGFVRVAGYPENY